MKDADDVTPEDLKRITEALAELNPHNGTPIAQIVFPATGVHLTVCEGNVIAVVNEKMARILHEFVGDWLAAIDTGEVPPEQTVH